MCKALVVNARLYLFVFVVQKCVLFAKKKIKKTGQFFLVGLTVSGFVQKPKFFFIYFVFF